MFKFIFLMLSASILSFGFISCQDKITAEVPENVSSELSTKINSEEIELGSDLAITTKMAFSEMEWNFGEIQEGEKANHTFTFTNTGTEPLIISNAKGSCGCTIPEWPAEPIAPGGTGEIQVVFNSKGKNGDQTKTVTITANTNPVSTRLILKGKVSK